MAQISNEFNVDLNVDELITSTENIEKYNKILETEIDNITQMCTELLIVWSSDSADITSSITKINECTAKIKEVINPVLTQYSETMNTLSVATSITSSKSIEG